MKALHVSLLLLSMLGASAPPDDVPPPVVEFLVVRQDATPAPVVAQPVLTPGLLDVVVCRAPCVVRAYPAGLVTITPEVVETGQIFRYRASYIDGATEKTWKGPCTVYLIECDAKSAKDGTVDIVATPFGFTKESDIATRSLKVDNQKKPKPPPDPIDPPKPVTKSFRVFFVYESAATMTKDQVGTMYAKSVADYLTAKTTPEGGAAGWRRYDKDTKADNDSPTMKALWAAIKPSLTAMPCLAIELNGKVEIVPLPTTPDEALTLLKKYGGP